MIKQEKQSNPPVRVAVVGAGLAGAVCASTLARHGVSVTVFDKGRKVGGRLASRTRDENTFDYGAQYFTARDERFKQTVSQWLANGWVTQWDGSFGVAEHQSLLAKPVDSVRYVALPSMHKLSGYLLNGLDVRLSNVIQTVTRDEDSGLWSVAGLDKDPKGEGETCKNIQETGFAVIVLSAPAAQSFALVPHPDLLKVRFAPCWAVMVSFPERLPIEFDGCIIKDHPLAWVARDSSKPLRAPGERWVLHANPDWSFQKLEEPEDVVLRDLLAEFFTLFKIKPVYPIYSKAHRWRYARSLSPLSEPWIYDRKTGVGYCGDWCGGERIESAFLSGSALAEDILGELL